MQIDLSNSKLIMDFHQKYCDKDILNKSLTPRVHEFFSKAFDVIIAGNFSKSCTLPKPFIEHQDCTAECVNQNVDDFKLKLHQTANAPCDLTFQITRKKDMFSIRCNLYEDPYVFSYSSKPIIGKGFRTDVTLHENEPFSWSSLSYLSKKDEDGVVGARSGNSSLGSCLKDNLTQCQESLLDAFKSSLAEFKQDAMANNEATQDERIKMQTPPSPGPLDIDSQSKPSSPSVQTTGTVGRPFALVLTGIAGSLVFAGLAGIGVGLGLLYAKHKSHRQSQKDASVEAKKKPNPSKILPSSA